ncbi:serine protease, partial [Genlisea aurea]
LILLPFLSAIADEGNDHSLGVTTTYIVHVEPPYDLFDSIDLQKWYFSFLPETANFTGGKSPIVHSYRNVFSGFAAKLSEVDVEFVRRRKGFISATPQRVLQLHTTRSPEFMGLRRDFGLWKDSDYGKGVIVGVLDTGIFPNHPSFDAGGMPPPPQRWKGKCEFNFTACNDKIIGARNFIDGEDGPMDRNGHGTHSASTAAGRFVGDASVYGNAKGTAAGVAPMAHLAIYKSCTDDCLESDVLAAMDAAIDDGVDVISISFGGFSREYYDDNIALGAYSAMQRGIFVSCSAGNNGPFHTTLSNEAPWILTVGASTIDRKLIRATAVLGNSEELNGESNYQPADFPSTDFPLIFPGLNSTNPRARYCYPSFGNLTLTGTIVVCEDRGGIGKIAKGRVVRNAGAAGLIIVNGEADAYTTPSESHVIPATHLSYADGQRLIAYLNSTANPTAAISFRGTIIGDRDAPVVASYSSRGPNTPSRGILKPDIIGPGHNILAGWYQSLENTDSHFNIISGTSMACPHLSGAAALIKNAHPDWSPAAIKSALMTTADQTNIAGTPIQDQTLNPADAFATGSGHVNIARASNPGLIYDIQPDDYLPYLCGLNYTDQQVGIIANRAVNCSNISSIPEAELNYPSFSVFVGDESLTFNRTVTNVGEANEVYTSRYTVFPSVDVKIEPSSLQFTEVHQRITYQVTFAKQPDAVSRTIIQGSLTWTSASHSVRCPVIAVI